MSEEPQQQQQQQQQQQVTYSFQDILADKTLKELFRSYLKQKYCHENIDFYDEVEEFRLISDPTRRELRSRTIFEKYIENGSAMQINVDSHQYTSIANQLEQKSVPAHLFDEAQTFVFNLMRDDSLPSFLISDAFKKCISAGPLLPVYGTEAAEGEKIVLVTHWNHSNAPQKNKLAKKLQKELEAISATRQMAGDQALAIQDDIDRLNLWCRRLESDSQGNRKRINQLEKQINQQRQRNSQMRQQILQMQDKLCQTDQLLTQARELMNQNEWLHKTKTPALSSSNGNSNATSSSSSGPVLISSAGSLGSILPLASSADGANSSSGDGSLAGPVDKENAVAEAFAMIISDSIGESE